MDEKNKKNTTQNGHYRVYIISDNITKPAELIFIDRQTIKLLPDDSNEGLLIKPNTHTIKINKPYSFYYSLLVRDINNPADTVVVDTALNNFRNKFIVTLFGMAATVILYALTFSFIDRSNSIISDSSSANILLLLTVLLPFFVGISNIIARRAIAVINKSYNSDELVSLLYSSGFSSIYDQDLNESTIKPRKEKQKKHFYIGLIASSVLSGQFAMILLAFTFSVILGDSVEPGSSGWIFLIILSAIIGPLYMYVLIKPIFFYILRNYSKKLAKKYPNTYETYLLEKEELKIDDNSTRLSTFLGLGLLVMFVGLIAINLRISYLAETKASQFTDQINIFANTGDYQKITELFCNKSAVLQEDIARVFTGYENFTKSNTEAFSGGEEVYIKYISNDAVSYDYEFIDVRQGTKKIEADRSEFKYIVSQFEKNTYCLDMVTRKSYRVNTPLNSETIGSYPVDWKDKPGYKIYIDKN